MRGLPRCRLSVTNKERHKAPIRRAERLSSYHFGLSFCLDTRPSPLELEGTCHLSRKAEEGAVQITSASDVPSLLSLCCCSCAEQEPAWQDRMRQPRRSKNDASQLSCGSHWTEEIARQPADNDRRNSCVASLTTSVLLFGAHSASCRLEPSESEAFQIVGAVLSGPCGLQRKPRLFGTEDSELSHGRDHSSAIDRSVSLTGRSKHSEQPEAKRSHDPPPCLPIFSSSRGTAVSSSSSRLLS